MYSAASFCSVASIYCKERKGEFRISQVSAAKTLSPHTVQMDRRKQALITGVTDVSSFHEKEIVLRVDEALMVISGENLHIGRLLLEDGKLEITGRIDAISYEAPHQSVRRFFARKKVDS